MKYLTRKNKLAGIVSALFALSVAAITPQAFAYDATAKDLEQKVNLLEDMLRSIQNELNQMRSESAQQVVQQVEKTLAAQDHEAPKHNMVFFRGGFTHAMQNRNGSTIRSEVVAPNGDQADKDGFYVGAGFDFNLTNDVWGVVPKTSVLAELMFEYKEFGDKVLGNGALANAPSILVGGALNARDVTVSQFTLTASPKIKFLEGSKIRPWVIPGGLAIHVISPTSESVTYLLPGVMFGAGIDYNIWKSFYLGVDARYNLTMGKADGVRVDGMTAGGYVGIGF